MTIICINDEEKRVLMKHWTFYSGIFYDSLIFISLTEIVIAIRGIRISMETIISSYLKITFFVSSKFWWLGLEIVMVRYGNYDGYAWKLWSLGIEIVTFKHWNCSVLARKLRFKKARQNSEECVDLKKINRLWGWFRSILFPSIGT